LEEQFGLIDRQEFWGDVREQTASFEFGPSPLSVGVFEDFREFHTDPLSADALDA
jgi:hypothetical protein